MIYPHQPQLKLSQNSNEVQGYSSRRSRFLVLIGLPFRILWKLINIFLLVVFALLGFAGISIGIWIVSSIIYFIILIFLAIFDLIFRLDLATRLSNWVDGIIQYLTVIVQKIWIDWLQPVVFSVWASVINWGERSGWLATAVHTKDTIVNFGTEVTRTILLLIIFIIVGGLIYHLRLVRRITYGIIELIVAILAMWVAIGGMSGGNFTLPYFLSLFTGFYVMVRGMQNLDEGLKQKRELAASSQAAEPAHAWVKLWEALFYKPYQAGTYKQRGEEIADAWKKIAPRGFRISKLDNHNKLLTPVNAGEASEDSS